MTKNRKIFYINGNKNGHKEYRKVDGITRNIKIYRINRHRKNWDKKNNQKESAHTIFKD